MGGRLGRGSTKKNDCVAEAQLLAKYKGLVSSDPNLGKSFSIWEQNMEFARGEVMDGVCADDEDNNKAFSLENACKLIGYTSQKDEVQVIHQNKE